MRSKSNETISGGISLVRSNWTLSDGETLAQDIPEVQPEESGGQAMLLLLSWVFAKHPPALETKP